MADLLTNIEELTQKISILQRNFKKDGLGRKTSVYIKERVEKLHKYYAKFNKLEKSENELVISASQKLEKLYQDIYNELDNFIPTDCRQRPQKAKSTERLNFLEAPENVDTIKEELFEARNKLNELNENLLELTIRLQQDLNIHDDSVLDLNGVEKLEHLINESKQLKERAEVAYDNEIYNLNKIITVKDVRLDELEKLLEEADQQDNEKEVQITKIEREESLRYNKLLKDNSKLSEEIRLLQLDLNNKEELILRLNDQIKNISKRRESLQHEFEDLEHQIQWDISPDGKENFIRWIKELNTEKEDILKKNRDLQKILEKVKKQYNLLQINIGKMEQYDKISKYLRDMVPVFIGGRTATVVSDVKQFLRCSNLIYAKIGANDKPIFMELIRTRLGGDAADLINNATIDDMAQMEQVLSKAYIPRKSFQSLVDEMKRAIQRPGETIQEFGFRLSKLLHDCKNEAKQEYKEENGALYTCIEKDAMKAYKNGLSSRAIKYHLMPIKKLTLAEMIEVAEEIHLENGQMNWTIDTGTNQNPNQSTSSPVTSNANRNQPNGNNNIQWARGTGGSANNGYNQGFGGNNGHQYGNQRSGGGYNNQRSANGGFRNGGGQQNLNNGPPLECRRCGRRGHVQDTCRTRQEAIYCTKCQRYGHASGNCRANVAMIDSGMKCRFCQRIDHNIENCVYKKEYEENLQAGNETGGPTDTVRPQ